MGLTWCGPLPKETSSLRWDRSPRRCLRQPARAIIRPRYQLDKMLAEANAATAGPRRTGRRDDQEAANPTAARAVAQKQTTATMDSRSAAYVLRQGRVSGRRSAASTNSGLPRWGIPYRPAVLDLDDVFGRRVPASWRSGCGMGETTALIAAAHPAERLPRHRSAYPRGRQLARKSPRAN